MIIYKDVVSGDEVGSDAFSYTEKWKLMWTCDINQISKDNDDANDSSNEGPFYKSPVYDYEENFQLQRLKPEHKPSKERFKSHLKCYIKKVKDCLKDGGCDITTLQDFLGSASNVMNHILENYDSYEVLQGANLGLDAMNVLVGVRDDGVTPYAMIWKHGVTEESV